MSKAQQEMYEEKSEAQKAAYMKKEIEKLDRE